MLSPISPSDLIRHHGQTARPSPRIGFLFVENLYTNAPSDWEEIPATIRAARDWLGY